MIPLMLALGQLERGNNASNGPRADPVARSGMGFDSAGSPDEQLQYNK